MRQRAEMLMDIGFKHSYTQSEAFSHDLKADLFDLNRRCTDRSLNDIKNTARAIRELFNRLLRYCDVIKLHFMALQTQYVLSRFSVH